MASVPDEWVHADNEIQQRVESGWISKDEGHRLRTLLKMGETPERRPNKESEFWTHTSNEMLKDLLLKKELPTPWSKFLAAIGVAWVKRKMRESDAYRSGAEYRNSFPLLDYIVHSDRFEAFTGVVMLANAIMIGFQVSLSQEDKAAAGIYTILDFGFTVFFVLELFARSLPEGWRWWCKASNLFDVVIVMATNIVPIWILLPLGIDNAVLRPFAVLRLFRVVKLGKLMRKYRRLKILWNLFQGMIGSGRILIYTVLMMGTTLFMFSVVSVVLITKNEATRDHELVLLYFQTVPEAFFTLFQIVTLDSWTSLSRPLGETSPLAALIITVNVLVVNLCLLNLVTATIVTAAFERQAADHEMVAREQKDKNDRLINDIQNLFSEMDTRGEGKLTYEEYIKAVEGNDQIQTKFTTLEIEDADELWNLIDLGTGDIAVDQFAQGLRVIAEETKAKDAFTINRRIGIALKRLQLSVDEMDRQSRLVERFGKDISAITQQLTMSANAMVSFMHSVERCIPRAQVLMNERQVEDRRHEILNKIQPLLSTDISQVSRLFNRSRRGVKNT